MSIQVSIENRTHPKDCGTRVSGSVCRDSHPRALVCRSFEELTENCLEVWLVNKIKHLAQFPVGLSEWVGTHPKHCGVEGCGIGKLWQEVTVEPNKICSLRSRGPEPMWFRKSAACRVSLCVNHEQPESSSAVHRREASVMDLDLPPDATHSSLQGIWGWMSDRVVNDRHQCGARWTLTYHPVR